MYSFFFFQAEDGIRYLIVTGVQTCALPIFAGWRGLGYDSVPSAHWVVVDGAIKKIASGNVPKLPDGQPRQGGDLMTVATFGDFELTWEWKVTPGANSGVKYNVSEELSMAQAPNHAALGFEYQMLDDDRHEDGKLPTHRAPGRGVGARALFCFFVAARRGPHRFFLGRTFGLHGGGVVRVEGAVRAPPAGGADAAGVFGGRERLVDPPARALAGGGGVLP